MRNLLVLSILILSACGQKFEFRPAGTVDLEFIPYVQQFILEAQKHGAASQLYRLNAVNIIFDDQMKLPYLGACRIGPAGLTIRMNRLQWVNSSYESRELRMFHELGHCAMGQTIHRDNRIEMRDSNGLSDFTISGPASLMNTYEIPSTWYASNRAYYISELFGNVNIDQIFYNGPSQFDNKNYVK